MEGERFAGAALRWVKQYQRVFWELDTLLQPFAYDNEQEEQAALHDEEWKAELEEQLKALRTLSGEIRAYKVIPLLSHASAYSHLVEAADSFGQANAHLTLMVHDGAVLDAVLGRHALQEGMEALDKVAASSHKSRGPK